MVRTLLLSLLIFVVSVSAQKRAFKLADLYSIKSVSDARISPNGKRIAFSVTSYDLPQGKSNSEIFVMNADGSNQVQLTDNPASDTHPRWSRDGKNILFVSTRSNGSQAWAVPANGGEARQLTNLSTGVSDAEWLGDGGEVVFTSTVFPECGADDSCNSKINLSMENGPLQAHMADHLLYRHWTEWKDGHRDHVLMHDPASNKTVDLTPGDYDSPAFWGNYGVSSDGKFIAVESNRDSNEAETTNKDIYLVEVAGGKTTDITAANKAYDGHPVFSPDGRYIAYLRQEIPTFESDRIRLCLYDIQKGESKVLTESIDNHADDPTWSADSKTIYFKVTEKGRFPLYKVDIKSGKIEKVLEFATIDDFTLSPDSKWIALTDRSISAPKEIYRVPISGSFQSKKPVRLTTFNKAVEDQVDLRPVEELWIPSPTGKKIHTFLIKPHNFDPHKKYPLIINVHGGPQSQWADAFRGDWQMYPGSGYVLAFPNPHGSTGYGQEFTNAISKDYGGKVFQDVMAVTDSLAKLPFVDANRMGAMGWSYGGYFMDWLQGHNTRFKCIVSMMGLFDLTSFYGATEELWFPQWDLGGTPWTSDLYTKWSPDHYVKNFKTPTLVITGEKDFRVPYTQSLEFFTALQKMGVPSRLIVFKNDGHWPNVIKSMPFYYNAHLDWFHKYLGGDPAPYDMVKMWRNQVEKW